MLPWRSPLTTTLSELLRSAEISPSGELRAHVPADWMQGRSAFGGLQVALAVRAMRALVPDAPLRAIQATFVGPVGESVHVTAAILRKGRNVTHAEAQILDGQATSLLVVGVFGEARKSCFSLNRVMPDTPATASTPFPHVPGVTPAFLQHFDARMISGAAPFSGSGASHALFEVGLEDEGPATEAHAVAISDFAPPLGLTYLSAPAPASTATWLLELATDRFDDLPLSGWRIAASLDHARDGYTSQTTVVWAPGGATVARGHQTMLVFG